MIFSRSVSVVIFCFALVLTILAGFPLLFSLFGFGCLLELDLFSFLPKDFEGLLAAVFCLFSLVSLSHSLLDMNKVYKYWYPNLISPGWFSCF